MIVVFDMGASRTRLALAQNGKLAKVVRMETDRSARGFAVLLGALEELVAGQKLEAVVGSLPGQLEGDEGVLALAPNLPEWLGLPVRLRLEKLFGCPVQILNDVVMGGLGEARDGAGITEGVMAYFTISTGVNAARIVDGRVDASISRYEIGKQLVTSVGGRPQTLESLVGGAALEVRVGKPPREVRDEVVWRAIERNLAVGLYNTVLHWTPEVVVFGGSMMRDIDLVRVAAELESLPLVLPRWPRLVRAKLEDTAGLHGAVTWFDLQGGRI